MMCASYGANAGDYPAMDGRRARGSIASPAAVQNGDIVFRFLAYGKSATSWLNRARIEIVTDGVPSGASNMPQRLSFNTGATASTERMRIQAGGQVNIVQSVSIGQAVGTTPAAPLDVDQSGTATTSPVVQLDQADVDEPFIKFIGTAAAADLTRSIVDDGDVASSTLVGWLKIEIDDVGNQVADGDYYVPFYTLSA
jgi:hypothetical protein